MTNNNPPQDGSAKQIEELTSKVAALEDARKKLQKELACHKLLWREQRSQARGGFWFRWLLGTVASILAIILLTFSSYDRYFDTKVKKAVEDVQKQLKQHATEGHKGPSVEDRLAARGMKASQSLDWATCKEQQHYGRVSCCNDPANPCPEERPDRNAGSESAGTTAGRQ